MGFERFQSICSECGCPVPGAYVHRGGAVYHEKTCPEHGVSYVLASEDPEAFERWLRFPTVSVPPRITHTDNRMQKFVPRDTGTDEGLGNCEDENNSKAIYTECPLHCGPCENHLMTACCVLLNVTDRCNQSCPYCFAEAVAPDSQPDPEPDNTTPSLRPHSDPPPSLRAHSDPPPSLRANAKQSSGDPPPSLRANAKQSSGDPTLEEIERWLDRLIEFGEERKFNIQLNGGEPTVREDLPEIIRMCKDKDFEYIQLNTNGRRLAEDPEYAKSLKTAGLATVFLQFDGIDDEVYLELRGESLYKTKVAAVKNCGIAGLPVTLVPTVLKSTIGQVGKTIDFMLDNISVVKGVHFQPASFFGRYPAKKNIVDDEKTGIKNKIGEEKYASDDFDERVTMFTVMNEIEKQTGGRIKTTDLVPISTGHPLCCFSAAFMKERDGARPLSSGGSCCDPTDDPLEIIRRDRDFVLNKWDIDIPQSCNCEEPESPNSEAPMSFDEAIAMFKTNSFTISGMAFMDETNLDSERLRRCRVQVFTPDEYLVPFCGYYTKSGV